MNLTLLPRVSMTVLWLACCAQPLWCQSAVPATTQAIELNFKHTTSPAGANSSVPNLIRGANNRCYLSWVETLQEGEIALKFSVFEEQQWSAPRTIIQGRNFFVNWADFPSVSVLKDGTIMAHWLRQNGTGYDYNAKFALSNDAGSTWTKPRLLHDDKRPAEHGFVSITPLNETTFAAIWLDGRKMSEAKSGEGNMILYYRTISSSGDLGPEQSIDERVCTCCQTSLISPAPGELLVAYRDRGAEEIRDISSASFDGKTWSQPKPVFNDNWYMPGCPVNGPALASHPKRQAVLWFTGAGPGGGRVNFATRRNSTVPFSPPLRIDDGSPVGRVDLIACEDYFLASWLEQVEGDQGGWRLTALNAKGSLLAPITLASVSIARSSGFLRMAPQGKGALLAWTSNDGNSSRVLTGRL